MKVPKGCSARYARAFAAALPPARLPTLVSLIVTKYASSDGLLTSGMSAPSMMALTFRTDSSRAEVPAQLRARHGRTSRAEGTAHASNVDVWHTKTAIPDVEDAARRTSTRFDRARPTPVFASQLSPGSSCPNPASSRASATVRASSVVRLEHPPPNAWSHPSMCVTSNAPSRRRDAVDAGSRSRIRDAGIGRSNPW